MRRQEKTGAKRKTHNGIKIVAILLLMLVCVGGVELAAARLYAPALYERIVAPVRAAARGAAAWAVEAARGAADWAEDTAEDLAGFAASLAPPEPSEELESQEAGEPALQLSDPKLDPEVTVLLDTGSGGRLLTGGIGDVVYFNQGEEPWAAQPYGSDNIAGYGCGPTVMAMAVSTLTGQRTDPAQMARWAAENGYWARKSGSYLSIVMGTASAYGLVAEPFTGRTADSLLEAVTGGKYLVALMSKGHFTQRGHFILLRGATLDGKLLVADPNSVERSLVAWDPQLILDELSASTNNGAPIWTLTLPAQDLSGAAE